MSQIEIQILKQGTETKKVISCSFFTMRDAYRDVSTYEHNLRKFCGMSKLPGFCLRIYTDDSAKESALEIASKYEHVSVYHFNCPEFREEVGHVGTFGTFVRFLPLFEKGLEIVWISDIDIPEHWLEKVPTQEFNYKVFICYNRKVYGRKYTILAGTIVSRITFPKQIFTRFLNNLANGKYEDMVDKLNESNKRKPPSKVPYGIDEVFANTSIYEYLIRHDVSISINYNYLTGLDQFLTYSGKLTYQELNSLKSFYIKGNMEKFNSAKILLKKHLPWAVSERPCFQGTLDLLPTFRTSFVKTYVLKGSELK
jgi:hypothetical protein